MQFDQKQNNPNIDIQQRAVIFSAALQIPLSLQL